jgi:tetratricopeptide (TPR) repeat protein
MALSIDPFYANGWFNKGNTLLHKSSLDEYMTCFEKALLIDPNYTDALNSKELSRYFKIH